MDESDLLEIEFEEEDGLDSDRDEDEDAKSHGPKCDDEVIVNWKSHEYKTEMYIPFFQPWNHFSNIFR